MKTGFFFLTLGMGMAAGGLTALMLPRQCKARQAAQKAADQLEEKVTDWMS